MLQRAQTIAEAVHALRIRLDDLGGSNVRIVAVAKGFPWVDVHAAMDAGVDAIGENYSQEIVTKYESVPLEDRPDIHFIGRLQSNKIGAIAPYVTMWQTVDRQRLLEGIALRAPESEVLIQVNTTGEGDKGGCAPEEAEKLVRHGESLGLRVKGLMVMGPTSGDRDETRAAFAAASEIRSRLGLAEMSMGMSGDVDLAMEWGTTMVRVGSALFGGRPPKN